MGEVLVAGVPRHLVVVTVVVALVQWVVVVLVRLVVVVLVWLHPAVVLLAVV